MDTARTNFEVDSDCTVRFVLSLPGSADRQSLNMRGFLVNGGKEILAFQTDSTRVATMLLRRK